MSRIGKKAITIPSGVEVEIIGQRVAVKGPKGELALTLHGAIQVQKMGAEIVVAPQEVMSKAFAKEKGALWGLSRTLVANMVEGVTKGYEKKLEIEGVGYKAAVEGDSLSLNVGFSHPVKIKAPQGISFAADKSSITVSGTNKEVVGQIAAKIRNVRPVEPYKGKGIRYAGEFVRRKLGKRVAGTTAK